MTTVFSRMPSPILAALLLFNLYVTLGFSLPARVWLWFFLQIISHIRKLIRTRPGELDESCCKHMSFYGFKVNLVNT